MSQQAQSSLVCYSADQIPYVWDLVKWHIKRATDRFPSYCLEDILEGLCNKSMQLWCWQGDSIEAAMVTTIQEDSEHKFCLLLAVGGESMNEWKDRLPIVEEWAKAEGCTEMKIYGRVGWSRVLRYNVDYSAMSKSI